MSNSRLGIAVVSSGCDGMIHARNFARGTARGAPRRHGRPGRRGARGGPVTRIATSPQADPARRTAVTAGSALPAWRLGQVGFLLKAAGVGLVIDPYLSGALAAKYRGKPFPHARADVAAGRAGRVVRGGAVHHPWSHRPSRAWDAGPARGHQPGPPVRGAGSARRIGCVARPAARVSGSGECLRSARAGWHPPPPAVLGTRDSRSTLPANTPSCVTWPITPATAPPTPTFPLTSAGTTSTSSR